MKIHWISLFIITLSIYSCKMVQVPESGTWRAVLVPDSTQTDLEIPFRMEITRSVDKSVVAKIMNAGEEILVKEVVIQEDSIHLLLPVFEGTIDARLKKKRMDGTYTHRGSGRSWSVPFYADYGVTDRFPNFTENPALNITGRWEVTVGTGEQTEKQIGEFIQEGSHLTGTFLTTTGDYRFLEGKVAGTKMMLSAFDGAHALVFQADLSPGGTLENGTFCGGPSWKGEWLAVLNDTVTLPDPTTLTFLKQGYEKLDFTFPDLTGNLVSLSDSRFQGKPVIVQIIGSWCPNCMDETRFFCSLYNQYKDKGLQIIALSYESANFAASVKAIERFRNNIGAEYTFLYAGESNKRKASETLPMLNRILSFPTSVFIDRNGNIIKIFTGFSGPGTGKHYQKLTTEMTEAVEEMIER
ncbi:MAG: TlpA disulfide reductase family protein [Bacteroidia bacterium]|nr:TlpA disulfide reductase family protein [Bacteroidia bacterium]